MKTTEPPIDLDRLDKLIKDDSQKKLLYLNQFLEILKPEILNLKNALESEDRLKIKKIVHKIGPQLVFFGLPNVAELVQKIESGYETLAFNKLQLTVNQLFEKIKNAVEAIESQVGNLS